MKKIFILLAASLAFSALFSAARDTSKLPAYKDEVLVVYKAEFAQADIDALDAKYHIKETTRDGLIKFLEGRYKLTLSGLNLPQNTFFTCYKAPSIQNMESLVEALETEPVVSSAQPNYLFYTQSAPYTPLAGPNDHWYKTAPSQWYLNQVRSDKVYNDLLSAITPKRDVIVAVVDTGVDIASNGGHEDLKGVTVTGNNILVPGTFPYDDDGHGTHVAGIIAANTNNITGIASIAGFNYVNVTWAARVKIMPIKALDNTGSGSDADIYTGIVWAADNGADIINMSLGGDTADPILKTAVNYAYGKGCLIVAAAGNSNSNTFYPAAYPNVMAVAATDIDVDACGGTYDVKADFSNYGKIDIAAPGVDIFSTDNTVFNAYSSEDGTSFSSPIVAGVAALVKMKYPDYTNDMIRSILEQSADDDLHTCSGSTTGNAGYDKYFGWGRVNAYRALNQDTNVVSTTEIKTYNWPNPFSPDGDGSTNIVFTLPAQKTTTVSIYDGGGQIVWQKVLQASEVSATGQNVVKWNGKNSDNKNASNGIYFYIVKTDNGVFGKNKIAVLY